MDSLTVSNLLPDGFEIQYVSLLYNQPSFLSVNNALPQIHFYLLDRDQKVVLGHIAFSREESEVLSPFRAPFGGFELASDLASDAFLFFATEVLRRLKESHIRFLRIHLPPEAYLPSLEGVKENLLALGFRKKQELTHHMLRVDEQSFEKKIVPMEKRKLKKAREAGCRLQLESRSQYAAVYEFIRQHRESKGHELSMTWDILRETIKSHPDQYLFCSVRLDKQVIAAAVMVRVNAHVLYYFIPGHDPDFNQLSPMVFLLGELYEWCKVQGITHIDLGTSYWANQENESLVKFKGASGRQAIH